MTLWDTTNTNTFLTLKDRIPKELQSSVVYKFTFTECKSSYIGKADRCLITRIKEHVCRKDSEIYNHIKSCEHIHYLQNSLNLPSNLLSLNEATNLQQLILNNYHFIDKAKQWSLLLFKVILYIHRQKALLNHWTKASRELVIFNKFMTPLTLYTVEPVYNGHPQDFIN